MTEQEARKIIGEITLDRVSGEELEAINIAVEALEKQIPKKPASKLTIGRVKYKIYDCPICGAHFGVRTYVNYCENCGQKIDWRE